MFGLPVMITVTPADFQGRDVARDVFWRLPPRSGADCGYACDLVDLVHERLWLTLRIVSRPEGVRASWFCPGVGKSSARSAGA